MNPATPAKFRAKQSGRWHTPKKGRVIQGEKGIGRFAVLKLARKISVITREEVADSETILSYDFTRFDDDFVKEGEEQREVSLDEVEIEWEQRTPKAIAGTGRGTVIEMEALRGTWNKRMVEYLCRDVANLTDPVSRLSEKHTTDEFEIRVVCNGERRIVGHKEEETLKALIEDKAVFSIGGRFVSKECVYRFDMGTYKAFLDLRGGGGRSSR